MIPQDSALYLVISEEYALGRKASDIALAAAQGGVQLIQMREKNLPRHELLGLGRCLKNICAQYEVIFIVNDDPVLALACDADGVHVGQEDVDLYGGIDGVRKIIGRKIIGISTHSLEQVDVASRTDVDYIAFGPVFPTKTKNYSIGISDIGAAMRLSCKPLFVIGGINIANLDEVLAAGARRVAVIRDIVQAEDISQRTAEYIVKMKGGVYGDNYQREAGDRRYGRDFV